MTYKTVLISICSILFFNLFAKAQNIGINADGATPNSSAMLDIDVSSLATKKGLLIPRMTATEIVAMDPLPGAAQGLIVYQTDGLQGFYYNTSTTTTPAWCLVFSSGTGGWSTTGNAGTTDGTNFIGTTDNVALDFRVNNQKAGRIDQTLFNTFWGYQAGNSNTGSKNTGNGMNALYSNTDGNENTANGYNSLYSNTSGNFNTASGSYALYSNSIGQFNTASGSYALVSNTDGYFNTGTG